MLDSASEVGPRPQRRDVLGSIRFGSSSGGELFRSPEGPLRSGLDASSIDFLAVLRVADRRRRVNVPRGAGNDGIRNGSPWSVAGIRLRANSADPATEAREHLNGRSFRKRHDLGRPMDGERLLLWRTWAVHNAQDGVGSP